MNSIKLISILFLLALLAHSASAQISPGKLTHYHEKLEGISSCTKCHELGEAPVAEKCFGCHQAVELSIKSGTGYHSSPEVKSAQCASCHSDHNGREFEPVHWKNGKEKFDHNLAGYKLEGKHFSLPCEKCHRRDFIANPAILQDKNVNPGRTYLGLVPACVNCHLDEHRSQLPQDCLKCHTFAAWKPAPAFKHDNSYYKLTGIHQKTACEKCHPNLNAPSADGKKIAKSQNPLKYAKYKGFEFNNCSPCHKDAHKNKLGSDCIKCHTTDSFKTITAGAFNHDNTAYPLQGKHQTVKCEKCHKGGNTTAKLKFQRCLDCHPDDHKGQFASRKDGGDCQPCHTLNGFKPAVYTVEKHQTSRYPLQGAHLAVPCSDCHKALKGALGKEMLQFAFTDTSCAACHSDIHKGEAARWTDINGCRYCHTVDSWRKIAFDHNLSRFKLAGKHDKVLCNKCHHPQGRTVLKPLSTICSDCHQDIHYGQFAENSGGNPRIRCENCHRENDWKPAVFNHNKNSRYQLTGAHAKIPCGKCHKIETTLKGERFYRYKPLGVLCSDCHGKMDLLTP